ncbi:MAG: Hsp33 family molecular chaperone HslO [Pseudomonadota bacterium]
MDSHSDGKRRFLFEDIDMRGEIVHLDEVLTEVAAIHDYPQGVAELLGEFIAASVLLASTIKFKGSLTVQARSDREIPLIMAECTSEMTVRAIARGAEQATAREFSSLLGGGQLVLSISPDRGNRYQGIVPLAADSLANSIDAYFEQSEQLPTRLFLASDGKRGAGLLLQQLPKQRIDDMQEREENWGRVAALAETLTADELLKLADEQLLFRLFHEEKVRVFDESSVRFNCSCSQDRTLAALATIGEAEIRDILQEQGSITMDCEFCNQRYIFKEADLRGLLSETSTGPVH